MYFQRKFHDAWELVSSVTIVLCMVAIMLLPVACTSWLGESATSTVNTATIAEVATDVTNALAAVDENTTNAELLSAVLAAIPNKYTTFFSAIINALEEAVEAEDTAATDTTAKVLLRPQSLDEIRALRSKATTTSKKVDNVLLYFLQQQADKIHNANDGNPFSFRGRTSRLEMVEASRGAFVSGAMLSVVRRNAGFASTSRFSAAFISGEKV